MLFFVLGVDAPDVGARLDELSEAHWGYMDGFGDRLVARGPTLTPDGETHTGSVHVVEVADRGAVRRFAFEEPFWRAGLYSSVDVIPFHDAIGGTMWDRPAAEMGTLSALVVATWPEAPTGQSPDEVWSRLTRSVPRERLVFGGLLLGDDHTRSRGLVFAADQSPAEAEQLASALAVPPGAAVSVQRWQRGGRPT